ncbi:MAG: hypothetical protein Fur003_0520 [Candidatus Dojkabacteria bacterium]
MELSKLKTLVTEQVEKLKELLNVEATITVGEVEEADGQLSIDVTFEGAELGYLIGNRGSHMRSLQYILSLLINRIVSQEKHEDGTPMHIYINLDVAGYNKERFSKIEAMAIRAADDARILGDSVDMNPLPAAERRVVHMILSRFDDVKTESFGEGEERYVRITPVHV